MLSRQAEPSCRIRSTGRLWWEFKNHVGLKSRKLEVQRSVNNSTNERCLGSAGEMNFCELFTDESQHLRLNQGQQVLRLLRSVNTSTYLFSTLQCELQPIKLWCLKKQIDTENILLMIDRIDRNVK